MGFIASNVALASLFMATSLVVGYVWLKILKYPFAKNYRSTFGVLVLGIFTLVSVFAFASTGFNTILLGLLIAGLYLFIETRHNRLIDISIQFEKGDLSFLGKVWIELSLVALAVIAYRYSFVAPGGYFIEGSYPDYVFYAKVSKYLTETGVERTDLDYIFSNTSLTPYHYFDLWINSMFVRLLDQNAVAAMIFISYTIGISAVWLGFVALAEVHLSVTIKVKILGFILLFMCGLYLGGLVQHSLIISTGVFTKHVLNYSKLYPTFLILLLVAQRDWDRELSVITSLLLSLIFLNISLAPGVFVCMGLILLIRLFKLRKIDWPLVAKASVAGVFIIAFYFLNADHATGGWSFEASNYAQLEFWVTVRNIIIGAALQQVIMYGALFVIVFWVTRNRIKVLLKPFAIASLFFVSFILPWALLHQNPNSVQLFSNFYVPFLTCFAVALVLREIKNAQIQSHKIALTLTLVVYCCFSFFIDARERAQLSKNEFAIGKLPEYQKFFGQVTNPVGVYFRDKFSWSEKADVFGALDAKFQQFVDRPGFHTVSLSSFDVPIDSTGLNSAYETNLIKQSVFYKYVMQQNPNLESKSIKRELIEQYQLEFIQDYEVEFILTPYNCKLPTSVSGRSEIVFADQTLDVVCYRVVKK